MSNLLDGNVLVALVVRDHVFHRRCSEWMANVLKRGESFATCPLTEGTLLRIQMIYDPMRSIAAAWDTLSVIRKIPGHQLWLDNFSYSEVPHEHLQGHRQITDAWLVELARRQQGKLATLDAALATLHPDVVELIPVIL
ncbi:MAG: TA system VapC family ribonuclease toxin [Roseibacillus sp.]